MNIKLIEDSIIKLDNLQHTYKEIILAIKNKDKIKDIENKINNGINSYKELRAECKVIRCYGLKQIKSHINAIDKLTLGCRENTVMFINKNSIDKEHGTQKPLELMSRIVKLVSNENDIILDCFAGSGSTLLGAIKNNRNYIGIEIDREYYNICCNRIKEKQGLFAGV
ncbi:site-specific DNA-methyltransferase [uncultured Brachyspira sp.]|uniref:site-specific DNA-methyltransferase n=1 Tax=uncultured Brachyspira sp. TaxID=221953 RepID=UPI0025EEB90F|nr:site-specific DNA-methyltransferase [uncultured Brachyspira sp.]